MGEQPHDQPDQENLETYQLGDRTLQQWHDWLTTDRTTGEPSGHLDAPGSRYGSTSDDCAWWAIAVECVYAESNGLPDEPEESMDFAMGLVVNDSSEVETMLRDRWFAVPDALKEKVELDLGFRYESARDEALHLIATEGWANQSGGDVAAPTGHFAAITNTPEHLTELRGAFEAMFNQLGLDPSSVLGHFIVVEDQNHAVHVVEYAVISRMLTAFEDLRHVYQAWLRGELRDQP